MDKTRNLRFHVQRALFRHDISDLTFLHPSMIHVSRDSIIGLFLLKNDTRLECPKKYRGLNDVLYYSVHLSFFDDFYLASIKNSLYYKLV